MKRRKTSKLLHEGHYAAEVEIELIEEEGGWSPYISPGDAQKLDDVREALRNGDLRTAGRLARVYELTPIAV